MRSRVYHRSVNPPRRQGWRGRLYAAVLGSLLAIGLTGLRAYGLHRDLAEAQVQLASAVRTVEAKGLGLTAPDALRIAGHLGLADASLARIEATLADPTLGVFGLVPPAATQLDAARRLVHVARLITSRSVPLRHLLQGYAEAVGGQPGPERFAAIARLMAARSAELNDLLSAVDEAYRIVEGVPAGELMEPLRAVKNSLAPRLQEARQLIGGIRMAVRLLPSMVGVGGLRRYLVLALDNAEVRPVGGLIAAFATPSFRKRPAIISGRLCVRMSE